MKLIKLGNKLKLIKPDSCYYMGGVNVLPPPATVIEYFFFAIFHSPFKITFPVLKLSCTAITL